MKQFASRTLMLLLAAFLACGTAVSCGKKEEPNSPKPETKVTDSAPSSDSTRPSDTSNEKPTDEEPTTPVNPPVPAVKVSLDRTTLSLPVGEQDTLTATVVGADDPTLTWSSSNPAVASVENGTVTAIAEGTAEITVALSDGTSATCTVTVTASVVPASSVVLDMQQLSLMVGENATLTATVLPDTATDKRVFWRSSNASVAMVQDGLVTAVGKGTATVTAFTDNGKTATCTITVEEALPSGLNYKLVENDSFYMVTGYFGNAREYIIPPIYDGLRVIGIQESAFKNNTWLQKITVPTNIEKIGASAFEGCTALTEFTIPKSVTKIEPSTFEGCTSLASIRIHGKIEKVGEKAFAGCSALADVTVEDGVGNIGANAFSDCTMLVKVIIGNNVGNIGDEAFINCTSLRTLTIGNKVGLIGKSAFYKCTSLSAVTIGTDIGNIGESAFAECTALLSVKIGEGSADIGEKAFSGCTALQEVTIGDRPGNIGEYAFENCTSLVRFTFGDGIKEIGAFAFDSCSALESVELPDSITLVGNGAFRHAKALKSVRLSKNMTKINNITFQYCESLKSVSLHGGITEIGNSAFSYCYGLEKLEILGDVTSIGNSAFYHCEKLNEIYYAAKTVKNYETNHYTFCRAGLGGDGIKLTVAAGAYVPDGLFEPVEEANRPKITEIVFEDGTEQVTYFAIWSNFTYLKKVTIPRSVKSIPAGMFKGSKKATIVSEDEHYNITWYDNSAFNGEAVDPANYAGEAERLYPKQEGKPHLITIDRNIEEAGSVSGGGTYPYGTTATLTVTNDSRYDFLGWYEGDTLLSKNERYSFSVSGDRTIIAKWEEHPFTITTERNFEAAGTVSGGGTYPYGTTTTLTATTDDHQYDFLGWYSGDTLLSDKQQYTFTVSEDQVIVAKWKLISYSVTINQNIAEAGTTDGFGSYGRGSTVTVRATLARGYQFVGWYENGTLISDAREYTISDLGKDRILEVRWRVANEYTFNYTETECTITGVTDKTRKNYSIPEYVTKIGSSAFSGCSSLTSITIPNGVTSIGEYAFRGCSSLTGVYITDLAKWCGISFGSFNANPLYYAHLVYLDGTLITDLVIPEGVTCIGSSAFSGCSSLSSITIPDSVTSIGSYAFYGCNSLSSITIPEGVTSIGDSAFEGCSSLKGVYITDLVKWCGISFGSYDANPLYYAHQLYLNGTLITDLVIPDSVTSIGDYAFSGCSSLTGVYITDIAKWCGISFGNSYANPLTYAHQLYLNGMLISDLVIPNNVTSIGDYAFSGCSSLTSITIPDSVTSIGEDAFSYCSSLTSITIPGSVTSIGDSAFYRCSSLTSITIPDSVTSIGYKTFYCCSSLTSITIPDSVTSIGDYAFYYCSSLTSITIGNGVTSIGSSAFYCCSSLTSITIGNGVTRIDKDAFAGCSSLTGVYISDLAKWCGISFNYQANPLSYAHQLYLNGTPITDLVIPDSVTSIASDAFRSCNLTSVTIPDSVTSIGGAAFYCCSSLTGVYITDLVKWCGISFEGFAANPLLYANKLYLNGTLITDLEIPEGVTSIGNYAFYKCSSLTSITIPDSVTSIGGSAFSGCYKLVEVYNKSALPIYAGRGEYGAVGYYAKAVYTKPYTSKLSVDKNGYIFYTDGNTVSLIGYAGNATSLILPTGISEIYAYAFYGCSSLTVITIPEGVTSIGSSAFYGCSSLTSITIPNGVTSIGDSAFSWCSSLTSITIGNGVTSIGDYAFSNCSSLTSITIPNGVTSIGSDAFYYCSSLTSITIPEGVTNIGDSAFYYCSSLTSITFNGTIAQWEAISKGRGWNSYTGSYTVHCTDGNIKKEVN